MQNGRGPVAVGGLNQDSLTIRADVLEYRFVVADVFAMDFQWSVRRTTRVDADKAIGVLDEQIGHSAVAVEKFHRCLDVVGQNHLTVP